MAKTLIRKMGPHATLYRDPRTGIAWVEDTRVGIAHSAHPNIDASGSVAGMKRAGVWGKSDRTKRLRGFIYNIDILHTSDDYDVIAARACQCAGNHSIHEGKAPGGTKRHSYKLVNARKGKVLDRERAETPRGALRKFRAKGHGTTGVSAVRYGGKKRHAPSPLKGRGRQKCVHCDKPSISGMKKGQGLCQQHWDEYAFGKQVAAVNALLKS